MKAEERTKGCDDAPRLFDVVMINDDITSYIFVVLMLMDDFRMTSECAEWMALTVHNDGRAIIMTTTREVAEEKAANAVSKARQLDFPLRIEIAPSLI